MDTMRCKIGMHGTSMGCSLLFFSCKRRRWIWMSLSGAGWETGNRRLPTLSIPVGRWGLANGCDWKGTASHWIRGVFGLEVFN
jgi:hypothetical protein